MVRDVYAVLPAGVDDPGAPSGGNRYDRQICHGLARAGWTVRELLIRGAWPGPDPAGITALAAALDTVPDNAVVLLDGLFAAAPEVITPVARRVRLVVLVHLPLADETGLAPEAAAELSGRERRTLGAAAAVVATSGWAARRVTARHGVPADRVAVALPGATPAPPTLASPALALRTPAARRGLGSRLLCVASVTPRKGHDVLVEALRRVADQPWRCVCVGGLDADPDFVDRVRRAVRGARLAGRFTLAGPLTGAALSAAYATADLLVLASHAETYGMVVTEALARGIPVLATGVGGVPEALGRAPDGTVPGRLVRPGDPAALAAALRTWLTEPHTRERLRRAARGRRAALPRWEATVAALGEVFGEVLRAGPAGGAVR